MSISRAVSELLTDSTVTETNMMQFLGVIEQRTNEIMQRLAYLTQDALLAESAGSLGAGAPGSPGK